MIILSERIIVKKYSVKQKDKMNSFKRENVELPLSAVWLTNSIAEYKGKQELYAKQSPQILKTLLETALIESAESSNRIEGVTVDHARLKPLVIGHSKPRDRSEEEVAGYRKALDLIHTKQKLLKKGAGNPQVWFCAGL